MKIVNVDRLMKKLNYQFNNKKLLYEALTHRSYINENNSPTIRDNERLEFLGDAVVDLIITEYIFKLKKDSNEGILSKLKGQVISEVIFSEISKELELGNYIYLSNGEENSGGRERKSILGDAFEALMGAIFLDSDFLTVKKIVLNLIENKINNIHNIEAVLDYKTELQELTQSMYKIVPKYVLKSEIGPDHDKTFEVEVYINDEFYALGVAKSKKNAEKMAAKKTIDILKGI